MNCNKYKLAWHLAIELALGHTGWKARQMWLLQFFNISYSKSEQSYMKVHSGGNQQMWPVQTCNRSSSQSKNSYNGTQWSKAQQMWSVQFSTHKTANLKKHMKVISGEKSNKCDPCKFSTTQAANLRIHIWKHHGENPQKCDLYRLNIALSDPGYTTACIVETEVLWNKQILNQRLYCLPAWEKNKCKNV